MAGRFLSSGFLGFYCSIDLGFLLIGFAGSFSFIFIVLIMDSSTKSANLSKSTLLGDAPILKSILKKSVTAGSTSAGSNDDLRSVGQKKGVEDGKLGSDCC